MIKLHRLNGAEIALNAELIESLESGQETVVNLATGNRFLVKEGTDEIIQKVLEYRRQVTVPGKAVNPIYGYQREQG